MVAALELHIASNTIARRPPPYPPPSWSSHSSAPSLWQRCPRPSHSATRRPSSSSPRPSTPPSHHAAHADVQANSCSLLIPNNDAAIAESSQVTADLLKALEHCPTKSYMLIQHDGVAAADYADGRAMPQLSQYMSGQHSEVKSTVAIPDVVGTVDVAALANHLLPKCGRDDGFIYRATIPVSPGSDAFRIEQLQRHGRQYISRVLCTS